MNIQDLKIIEVQKEEYSIKLKFQRIPSLTYKYPNDDVNGQLWRSHIISFILTKLFSGGTIYAEFKEGQKKVTWWYSSKVNPSYDLVEFEEEILVQELPYFRTVIAILGLAVMDKCYFGAGVFFISFYDNPKETVCVSCILSNTRETGFWIKLQNLK